MKKILILLAVICCCGCSDIDTKVTKNDDITRIKMYKQNAGGIIYSAEIEGHIYILYTVEAIKAVSSTQNIVLVK